MKIGAHVSTAGGLDKAYERAQAIGAEAIQIFGSSPQSWAFKMPQENVAARFRQLAQETGISPAFIHAIYLINLGSPNPDNLRKSIQALVDAMTLAAQTSVAGVIFHAGSHKGAGYDGIFKQTVDAIQEVLERSPQGPYLVIENSAGMGQHIGSRFDEIGRILRAVDSPRLRVCLDTEHSFAAGYNLADRQGILEAMEEFDKAIGLGHLVAVHANDAKVPFGSGVDRHANIGEGFIGTAGFEVIMAHPAFHHVPFLLEVPGLDNNGPDAPNVQALKDIRARLGVPV